MSYKQAQSVCFDDLVQRGLICKARPSKTPAPAPLDYNQIAASVVAALQPQLEALISKTVSAEFTQLLSVLPAQLAAKTTPTIDNNPEPLFPHSSSTAVPSITPPTSSPPVVQATPLSASDNRMATLSKVQSSLATAEPPHNLTQDAASQEEQALSCVRHILDDSQASWTCDGQRLAVMATLNRSQDVVSILATNAGKTMQVLVPTKLEPLVATVVVLPLKALIQDYSRRLKDLKIPYETWSTTGNMDTPLQGYCNLILVMIDQAQKPAFARAITNYHDRSPYKVGRWVFEEAHYALTASNFRASFQHLDELRAVLPVQFVLLSGTIPPQSLSELKQVFGLASQVQVIRTCTARPELQYLLDSPVNSKEAMLSRLEKYVKTYSTGFRPRDRGLIYCDTLSLLNLVTTKFGCPGYHGGSSSNREEQKTLEIQRESAYNQWIKGTSQWMACTTAFAAGCDCSHVRTVIMAGSCHSLIDIEQQFDRGGRDRQHAVAAFIPWRFPFIPADSSAAHTGSQVLHNLLYQPQPGREGCLRYGLTKFNDGEGTACNDLPDAERCSRCHPLNLSEALPQLTFKAHFYSSPLITPPLITPPLITPPPMTTATSRKRPLILSPDENDNITEAHHASKKRKAERAKTLPAAVQQLQDALLVFEGNCATCDFFVTQDAHAFKLCKSLDKKEKGAYFDFKKTIQYPSYASKKPGQHNVCFRCGVPQIKDIHDTFDKEGETCLYPDVIVPTLFLIFHADHSRAALEAHFGQTWASHTEFGAWLGQNGEGLFTNSIWAFIWYICKFIC